MRKVPLSLLTPDMYLAKPVYQNNILLLKPGAQDLNRFVDNLIRIGIFHLYIEDELGEGIEIPDVVSDETRLKCKLVLQDTFTHLTRDGVVDVVAVSELMDTLLEEILSQPNILISLSDIGTTDDSTLVHSVNTTIFSLIIGKKLAYSKKLLKKLAEGALLHDIGKTLVDQRTLFKPGHLTPLEFEIIKSHTTYGYQVLKKTSNLTELSRIIALNHHERIDGSGYPAGLKGNEIHEFAKITAVADVYDALTAERCYRKSMSPHSAIEILMQESMTKLDANLTSMLIQTLAVYPNGSTVRLSNMSYGIVKEQNLSMPLRPIVRVLQKYNEKQVVAYELDLMKELDITIVEPIVDILE